MQYIEGKQMFENRIVGPLGSSKDMTKDRPRLP